MYMVLGAGSVGVNIYALSALLAGVLNAASQVVLHDVSQKEDTIVINLWVYTFVAIVLVVLLPLNMSSATNLENIFVQPVMIWVCIAIIITSVSSQIFRVKSFKYTADPSLIAPGMYFSVVVAAVLDVVFYNASVSFLELLGVLMICVSSILSIIKK